MEHGCDALWISCQAGRKVITYATNKSQELGFLGRNFPFIKMEFVKNIQYTWKAMSFPSAYKQAGCVLLGFLHLLHGDPGPRCFMKVEAADFEHPPVAREDPGIQSHQPVSCHRWGDWRSVSGGFTPRPHPRRQKGAASFLAPRWLLRTDCGGRQDPPGNLDSLCVLCCLQMSQTEAQ